MQWLEEVEVQAGSQLNLTASHDTYGISFSWPASNPETPAEQTIHCSEGTHQESSTPVPPAVSAGDSAITHDDKLSSAGSSSTVDGTGRDMRATTDAHESNSRGGGVPLVVRRLLCCLLQLCAILHDIEHGRDAVLCCQDQASDR